MENSQDHKLNRNIFLAIILLFAVFLVFSLMEFFTAFLAAIMFYVLSRRPMEWLIKRWNWKRSIAAFVIILISFFIILLPISLMATLLYKKAVMIVSNQEAIIASLKHFDATMQDRFHFSIIPDNVLQDAGKYGASILSTVLNSGFNFFTTMIMMYFFLYFLLININKLEAGIILYLPFDSTKISLFGTELVSQTFSNAVGVPLIAVMHGILAYIAYKIAGLDESGFWAVITGFASVIPVIGTGIVWIPAGLFLLATGHSWQGFFVLGWCLIILGSSDNLVRFMLAKKMANVHPVVTVLGIIIGLKYFGITGLIFGPLLISYFLILLKIYYVEYQMPGVEKKHVIKKLPAYLNPFGNRQAKKKDDDIKNNS